MAKVVAGSAEGVLTKELLNKLISYNAETGLLSWKKRDGNFAHTGKPCISTDTNKQSTYKRSRVQILGVTYTTSRVVYIMHHGSIPIGKHIDHINRDPLDNRIENLRAVTRSQNLKNQMSRKQTVSGYKGVFEHGSKWRAEHRHEGQRIRSKDFSTAYEAALAYDEILYKIDPIHAALNFPQNTP